MVPLFFVGMSLNCCRSIRSKIIMHSIPIPPKTVEVSYGEFTCPKCEKRTSYKHKERVRRQLVFFVVPFLGDTIAEYVECQSCRQKFPLDVLRTGISTDIQQILGAIKDKLMLGISIQEAESLLLDSGIDLPTVKRYVSVAAGIAHKKCERCHLTFVDSVPKCNKCGNALPIKGSI